LLVRGKLSQEGRDPGDLHGRGPATETYSPRGPFAGPMASRFIFHRASACAFLAW
jgi:hypothetical protein